MAKGGLKKWFDEEWVDVKTGKKCGRKSAKNSKRPYPSCRPKACLLYTSPSPRDRTRSRMPSSA